MSLESYGRQLIEDDDIAAVAEALRGDFLTTGPLVQAFEADLGVALDAPHVVACANGTAALHLALAALGIGAGDVAVVPAVTFLATANAARFLGAEVCFADVDPDNGLLTPEGFEAALAKATKMGTPRVVLPVHLAGQCVDMPAIAEMSRAAGLAVVEDACHAIGSRTHRPGEAGAAGEAVGSCCYSELSTFSFHPVKTIATGEGGAVSCRDATLAERMRRLRSHGIQRSPGDLTNQALAFDGSGRPNPWYHEMQDLGFNYRMPDILCALGRSQLAKLDRFKAQRKALVARYDALLTPLGAAVRPIARQPHNDPAWHLYPVLVDFDELGTSRAQVMQALRERGVGTQVHYIPVNRQPYYERRYGTQILPGAERYYARTLSLPLHAGMSEADVEEVVAALKDRLAPGDGAQA